MVFAILAAPRQHSRIDGSGSVGSVLAGPQRLTAKGQTFTVRMKLFGVPYLIRNRVVEFEPERRIAWRRFTANRWRYELTPTADSSTTVTETFDLAPPTGSPTPSSGGRSSWTATGGVIETLLRLKQAAEADALMEFDLLVTTPRRGCRPATWELLRQPPRFEEHPPKRR